MSINVQTANYSKITEPVRKTGEKSADNKEVKKIYIKEKKDIYNDTPIRKLGFLDEYCEALRPILSMSANPIVRQIPNLAYIPSTAYMVADAIDKYQKGEDGTGEKPSVKMGLRQAAYQGIVSVAAPIAIVKGVHKITGNLATNLKSKIPPSFSEYASKAFGSLKSTGKVGSFLSKAGMPAKIAGAAISILAISKLSKPVDFVADKFFNFVVDPLLGINKKGDKEA